jgi:hypothetical protein
MYSANNDILTWLCEVCASDWLFIACCSWQMAPRVDIDFATLLCIVRLQWKTESLGEFITLEAYAL